VNDLVTRLQGLLDAGQDNALLRFGLGQALLQQGQATEAARHLDAAVAHDPGYSAAWKLLGRAREQCGDDDAAVAAWNRGVEAAEAGGDKQAAREMRVFLKRAARRAAD
jgi:predicted Zn-dependent protease